MHAASKPRVESFSALVDAHITLVFVLNPALQMADADV